MAKKRLKIIVDMDDTAVDLLGEWLRTYNEEFGRTVPLAHITSWNISSCVPDGKKIIDIIKRPGFFANLKALPGAVEGMEYLLKHHEPYFCSSGYGQALTDKETWIGKNMPFMLDRAFLTQGRTPKHLLEGDVLLEDGAHNIIPFRQYRPDAYISGMAYPHITVEGLQAADKMYSYLDPAGFWKGVVGDIDALAEGQMKERFFNKYD